MALFIGIKGFIHFSYYDLYTGKVVVIVHTIRGSGNIVYVLDGESDNLVVLRGFDLKITRCQFTCLSRAAMTSCPPTVSPGRGSKC